MNDNFTDRDSKLGDLIIQINNMMCLHFFSDETTPEAIAEAISGYISAHNTLLSFSYRFLLNNSFVRKKTLLNIMELNHNVNIKSFKEYKGE
jgi:hypothetical protein